MKKNGKKDYALMAQKAFKEAVAKALERHVKIGVPAVFMKNGIMCYLLPNGKVVKNIKRALI